MRGLYVDTFGSVCRVELESFADSQRLVGGYCEGITSQERFGFVRGYANEDGIMHRMPWNIVASALCGHRIVGPVVFVEVNERDGEARGLTDNEIAALTAGGLMVMDGVWTVDRICAERELAQAES